MPDNVHHEHDGDVTFVWIRSANNGNRVSDEMAAHIAGVFDAVPADTRAIVLQTEGDDFCLGRAVMGEGPGALPEAYDMRGKFDVVFDFYDAFRRAKAPVIGAVQGRAAGFGCAMAALCDITIATRSARFQLPETSHGIMPTMAMSSLIDRLPRKAILYMTYSCEFIDAAHALSVGLASTVVDDDALRDEVETLVGKLRAIPLPAANAVKEFATNAIGLPMAAANEYARNLHANINSSSKMRKK